MGVPRLPLEVRAILVSFRAALSKTRPEDVQALRARALGLLDDVRASAASLEDRALLEDARGKVDRLTEATDIDRSSRRLARAYRRRRRSSRRRRVRRFS